MLNLTERSHRLQLRTGWVPGSNEALQRRVWGLCVSVCVCILGNNNHSPLDTLQTQPDVTWVHHREKCAHACLALSVVQRLSSDSLGETVCPHSWGKHRTGLRVWLTCPPSFLSALFTSLSGPTHHPQSWSHMTAGWSPQWVNTDYYINLVSSRFLSQSICPDKLEPIWAAPPPADDTVLFRGVKVVDMVRIRGRGHSGIPVFFCLDHVNHNVILNWSAPRGGWHCNWSQALKPGNT